MRLFSVEGLSNREKGTVYAYRNNKLIPALETVTFFNKKLMHASNNYIFDRFHEGI